MNKLFRTSVLASVLTVAGVAINATGAFAESVNVPFTGTVTKFCEVNVVQEGIVGNDPKNPRFLGEMFGQPGFVGTVCNAPATVSVGLPQDISAVPVPNVTFRAATAFSPTLDQEAFRASSGVSQNFVTKAVIDENLRVGMYINSGQIIPAGNYSFTVNVDVTPN